MNLILYPAYVLASILCAWAMLYLSALLSERYTIYMPADLLSRSVDSIVSDLEHSRNRPVTLFVALAVLFYLLIPVLIAIHICLVLFLVFIGLTSGLLGPCILFALYVLMSAVTTLNCLSASRSKTFSLELPYSPNDILWKISSETANKIGIGSIDAICLVPNTDLSIFLGPKRRTIYVGLALIENMPTKYLYALIAHEYGHYYYPYFRHFSKIGTMISVLESLNHFNQIRVLGRLNLSRLLIALTLRIFLVCTTRYMRINEYLADYVSIRHYGSDLFNESLDFIVSRTQSFSRYLSRLLREVVENNMKTKIDNVYRPDILDGQYLELSRNDIAKEKNAEDSRSTHPNFNNRIRFSNKLAVPTDSAIASMDYVSSKYLAAEAAFLEYYTRIGKHLR